jgi:alpha-ketoglutarate-dependent 2,4-dichlorophenoxyacetate dioxygenase
MLRAVEIPPPGTGGNTEFADSRTAFDELPSDLKQDLLSHDYIAAHSLAHSRKTADPAYFADLDPTASPMYRHKLVQLHEPSGRMNLYVAAHAHHIEDPGEDPISAEKSEEILGGVMKHVTQPKFVVSVPWHGVGDMMVWDNTCVLHRATGGEFVGKYRRDCRRTTVHDASPTAWGLNGEDAKRAGFKYV